MLIILPKRLIRKKEAGLTVIKKRGATFASMCIQKYEGEAEQFIRGDLNCDCKVNAVDLTLLKQMV